MKKFLGIVVLGLWWCNFSVAGEMKWECSYKDMNYINFQLDKDSQILKSQWQHKDFEPKSDVWNILFMDNEKVIIKDDEGFPWYWYYGTDQRAVYKNPRIQKQHVISNYNCVSLTQQEKVNVASKINFDSKEKQYEHTCGKDLGLRKGSKRFMECALKIMEMELELTKLNAEKEIALAQAEAARANQQTAKVAELNAMANAKSQKFKNNVGNLLLGLLVLGEINSAGQQANSFKKVFTCSSTGFATGTQYAVNCY